MIGVIISDLKIRTASDRNKSVAKDPGNTAHLAFFLQKLFSRSQWIDPSQKSSNDLITYLYLHIYFLI